MQTDLQRLVALEHIQEGQVAVLVSLLNNTIKIADRLVIVKDKAKTNIGIRHVRAG